MYAEKKSKQSIFTLTQSHPLKSESHFSYLKTQFTTFFAFQGYVLRVI